MIRGTGFLLFCRSSLASGKDMGPETKRATDHRSSLKFSFGEQPRRGYARITPDTLYTGERGFGLMSSPMLETNARSLCAENASFLFVVDLPEGDYDVKLTTGGAETESVTTVKGEARRLFLERVIVPKRKFATEAFTVNVRYKELANHEVVRIKKDEQDDFDWDHRLSLEFSNTHPCVSSLT